jgi:hypothetical protein
MSTALIVNVVTPVPFESRPLGAPLLHRDHTSHLHRFPLRSNLHKGDLTGIFHRQLKAYLRRSQDMRG